jgi:hypothetical protein
MKIKIYSKTRVIYDMIDIKTSLFFYGYSYKNNNRNESYPNTFQETSFGKYPIFLNSFFNIEKYIINSARQKLLIIKKDNIEYVKAYIKSNGSKSIIYKIFKDNYDEMLFENIGNSKLTIIFIPIGNIIVKANIIKNYGIFKLKSYKEIKLYN